MTRISRFVAALPLLALPGAAGASSGFRCATGRLVDVGDRLVEVRTKCGEPDATHRRTEKRKVSRELEARQGPYKEEIEESRTVEISIDEWTYDLGRNRLVRHLVFEDGRLVSVAEGDRGSKEP
jgi:hypothetical protein